MRVALAHAGHEVHGLLGVTLSDVGFCLLFAALLVAAWRAVELRGLWRTRYALLGAGLGALAVAMSPVLDRASADAFLAHMAEHMVMMLVAAPLLAVARPELLVVRDLRFAGSKRLARFERGPAAWLRAPSLVAGGAMFLALWAWHVPALFDAALESELLHLLEHASFLGAAVVFWRFVLLLPQHGTQFFVSRALVVFGTMVHSSALGALFVFSDAVWYAPYGGDASGLADQQAAGLLMWLAGLPLYLGVLGWLVVVWLKRDESESRQREEALVAPAVSGRSLS